MAPYMDRTESTNSDGTPLYASDYDTKQEQIICAALEEAWKCSVKPFGRLCPVDFYAVRDGRLVGVIEAKSRSHTSDKFPTVFFNVRKWLALNMAQAGLGVPAIFVSRFTDQIKFIRMDKVDASRVRIGGTKNIVKSHTDIEPVIEVPVISMTKLGGE